MGAPALRLQESDALLAPLDKHALALSARWRKGGSQGMEGNVDSARRDSCGAASNLVHVVGSYVLI